MTARACPHPFPFRWHRSMAEVMANEATDGEQIRSAVVAFFVDSSMENDGPESALTLNPGLPINAYEEREG
mgnify:FL=1